MTLSANSPFNSSRLLSKGQFFSLVDRVMEENNRSKLPDESPQKRIIEVMPSDRVLQILAGPGSGKTEMIVWRLLYDLMVIGSDPTRTIVTTFTRRAATELIMRASERAEALQNQGQSCGILVPDPQIHNVRIGTIHSLCEQILVDLDENYRENGRTLIDQAETFARMNRNHNKYGLNANGAVKRILSNDNLIALFTKPWEDNSRQLSGMRLSKVLLDMIAQHYETWAPRCEVPNVLNGVDQNFPGSTVTSDLIEISNKWSELLDKGMVVDFASIQRLFLNSQSDFIQNFDHVFVDEFQDSNPIQFAIHTKWLSNPSCRLTVVGDDDQALYRFRGSDIACFHGLKPYSEAVGVGYRSEALETNYRSTKTIVEFCQSFKKHTVLNELALRKTVSALSKTSEGDETC